MEVFMNLNEFAAQYYGAYGDMVHKPVPLDAKETALVLIDVQDCLTKDYYEEAWPKFGFDPEMLKPILEELDSYISGTLENIGKILTKCREKGIRPIHIKIEAYLPDAADTGRLHACAGMKYPPGMREGNFLPVAQPLDDEIILKKTCSGIHVGTPIDRILRNLGVKNVLVVGFYTDQCVSSSVRDLADLGYATEIIDDAIGALSKERHEYALQGIRKIYAASENTEALLNRLDNML
ncbi:cysteine hydrolase [Fusibacter paucivorans]|uniref:Cysteine hydrolase n=2 Tax=Fusibacter paucivorans TaxID=76009 RepID=A0ABS5PPD0_9FIRM|nr:cysteine hydrolase [Fusibacter paucivorans]